MPLISYPLKDDRREAVRQLLVAFWEVWPDSHYGPLHILIADYNALDHNLDYCRKCVRGRLKEGATQEELFAAEYFEPHDESELKASLLLLDMLALIPEEQRNIHGEEVEVPAPPSPPESKKSDKWQERHKNA